MEKCGFQRRLDRLRPRVAEDRLPSAEAPSFKGNPAELFAQIRFGRGWMHVSHRVQEFVRLALERRANRRSSMPETRHPKGRREIQKAIAIDIPDVHSDRALPEDREILGQPGHFTSLESRKLLREVPGSRARNPRYDFWQHRVPEKGQSPGGTRPEQATRPATGRALRPNVCFRTESGGFENVPRALKPLRAFS
jgi:hypothetical protein